MGVRGPHSVGQESGGLAAQSVLSCGVTTWVRLHEKLLSP